MRLLALGDVLDAQKNRFCIVPHSEERARIQEHGAAANAWEIMLDLEILKRGVLRQYFFQEAPERGNVPLTASQFAEQFAFGLLRRHPKGLIKGAIGRLHAQLRVQHQKRLAHRVHDVLGIGAGFRGQFQLAFLGRRVFAHQEQDGHEKPRQQHHQQQEKAEISCIAGAKLFCAVLQELMLRLIHFRDHSADLIHHPLAFARTQQLFGCRPSPSFS